MPGERGVRLRFTNAHASAIAATCSGASGSGSGSGATGSARKRSSGNNKSAGGGGGNNATSSSTTSSGAAAAVELFAHPFMLRTCSRVLAELLESCGGASGGGGGGGGESSSGGAGGESSSSSGDPHVTIPLDGDDVAMWDDALSFMYAPAGRRFEVAWGNAAGLLVLADKYDMPGIRCEWMCAAGAGEHAMGRIHRDRQ